jgi:hypothetical protein
MAGMYRPRHPERTVLYRVLFHYFERFLAEYESRFEKEYGFLRPIIKEVVERYLDCGKKTTSQLKYAQKHQNYRSPSDGFLTFLRFLMLFDVLGKKILTKSLPFCLPGFRRRDWRCHFQRVSTFDDSLRMLFEPYSGFSCHLINPSMSITFKSHRILIPAGKCRLFLA